MPKHIAFVPVLILILLGAGCQPTTELMPESPTTTTPDTSAQKVYCSPDNNLIDHQVKQSFNSYCLVPVSKDPLVSGKAQNYAFTIVNNFGETVKNFEVVHEKLMHIVLMNNSLGGFQHLHPEYDPNTNIFTIENLTFPNDGEYLIYLDFKAEEGSENRGIMIPQLIAEKLVVGKGDNATPQKLTVDTLDKESNHLRKTVDNYIVSMGSSQENLNNLTRYTDNKFNFTVDDINGKKLNPLEKYLGTYGHLVIVHEQTHQYIHVHPVETAAVNSMEFDVKFPLEGTYKLFFQFQHDGKVHRTEYVVSVGTGAGSSATEQHSSH